MQGKLIKERRTFNLINYRCNTPTSPDYKHWGGRGIEVLFKNFEDFYKEIGDAPSLKHSIDRIDNNGHYAPGNVRWVTRLEQCFNKRTSRMLTYKGITKCLAEWSKEIGINATTINGRLERGWSIEDSLEIKDTSFRLNKRQNTHS